MNCSQPGSSVHGISQARILPWVVISFFRGSSCPRDRTQVSWVAGRFFTIWATREALKLWPLFKIQENLALLMLHTSLPYSLLYLWGMAIEVLTPTSVLFTCAFSISFITQHRTWAGNICYEDSRVIGAHHGSIKGSDPCNQISWCC